MQLSTVMEEASLSGASLSGASLSGAGDLERQDSSESDLEPHADAGSSAEESDSGEEEGPDNLASQRPKRLSQPPKTLTYETLGQPSIMRKRVETHGFQLQQMRGDLFTCPRSEALAHCISEDCQIGAGIATLVREKFSGVQDLLSQKRKAGECVVLNQGNRFVYYLITKGKSHQKPSCGSLWKSLEAMRNHCIAKGVTSVSMPRTGCGLDHLEWKRVLGIIKDVFKDTDIHITVFTL
ncbi:ADP-ribose glycohydrolase OARD1-like [Acipenser oxyrinchus oxyrinchus]|uniref:ADP-ribose glycohydrolase OARD1-like n=1 Tax=Acipenser oxyrinchus oxyrinchus TaxID=40147 RepID=A0AAD8GGJ5_ACIOX|nr:ADP-ribose glycohydrolase OARD1-like [Acipenser oxyrinchus oxyrinchus]